VETNTSFSRKTLVRAEFGIHARPASKIAQMAESAHSAICLRVGTLKADATDVLDILSLGAVKDTEIAIEMEKIEKQEDMEILSDIFEFFESGFGETI
jgi:phosphocarrier protein HPr